MQDWLIQTVSGLLGQTTILSVWTAVWPYLLILLGFSVIVFVHELGHFVAAKWAGVRVDRFAIGFGREFFGFTRGETRYSFNVLPLGGYVKMLGQEDFDDKAQEVQFKADPRSFINKSVGQRMVIVSAGVVMNIVLACLLFMIVFLIGMEAIGTRIAYVEPDSPAERAGLLPGDRIRKINNETILEWREVMTTVMLAPPHTELDILVERNGERKTIPVKPEYLIPENTREAQRLVVGISPGVTRQIFVVGPEIDTSRPDHPRPGDVIVEIDGMPVTDDNVNEMLNLLPYAKGDVYVERQDPTDPGGPPTRVRVQVPPILTLYPSDGEGTVSVLGLSPLVRVDRVDDRGRFALAGIEPGDTILNFNDRPYPTRAQILRAIQDHPDRDIYFSVRKLNGAVRDGFVRPRPNPRGAGTIGARIEAIPEAEQTSGGPKVRFAAVPPGSPAAKAGIRPGDDIIACANVEKPSLPQVLEAVRNRPLKPVPLRLRSADGRTASTQVIPVYPGAVDAGFNLVANDVLRVADVVPTIAGRPSPAAQAGMEAGALIKAVDAQPVQTWRELIDEFRVHAGSAVPVTYVSADGQPKTIHFPVPHCLRTLLGVGPEARINSIGGKKTVKIDVAGREEEVAVGYRKGTAAALESLVEHKNVPVEVRPHPLADIETRYIEVTEDMIDPWLGRAAYSASIEVAPELTLLKSRNPLQAMYIGIHKTYYFILQVYTILERMIFTRTVGVKEIAGPLGIIDLGGKIARTGLVEFLFFMAIISANLAVINFLPLPIVDGGLMVFLIIEKIKGSPVSLRVQVATQVIGLFLIIGIFLFVTFNDAMRMWG